MDSVNKYGSDGVPFTGNIAEITPAEQQLQQMIDAFVPVVQSIIDDFVPVVQSIIDDFVPVVQSIIDDFVPLIESTWNAILREYPDKRVVWLAFHHKKARIRNKNRKRIVKYIRKAVKRDDQSGTKGAI